MIYNVIFILFRSETKKKKNGKRFLPSSALSNQYQLDAGQKNFGATQCKDCGIIYNASDPVDENAHLNYHNSFRTLSFPVSFFSVAQNLKGYIFG